MQEKYNNLQDYLDFEFTGVKSFFGYEFRSHKACVLASGSMYMPSQELCDKYKLRNPCPNAGAIHKESRQHYISGKLNPMITVPNTSLREFSKMMRDEWKGQWYKFRGLWLVRLSKVDISDEDVISEIDMKVKEVVLTEKSM